MSCTSQQTTRFLKVDSDLLMTEASLASQTTSLATDGSDICVSIVLKMKGRAPNRMDEVLPSTNLHNDFNYICIRFFTPAWNAYNSTFQKLL